MTTSRIRSKGSIEDSSRFPATRVTRKMKRKMTVARIGRSIGSGEARELACDRGHDRVAVIQLAALGAAPPRHRSDLVLEPQSQRLPRAEGVVVERDPAVAVDLLRCLRLAGVEREAVEEAVVEHN